jgi:gamma-glutamylcyclotransferase (GGCT)/AIG2-like uncharacterized protein YtfP
MKPLVLEGIDWLFVYGTLMRGECRHGALGGRMNVLEVEPAEVPGRLVNCGTYPGFLNDPGGGSVVKGELVRMRDVKETLALVDRIEGFLGDAQPDSLFDRTLVEARTATGRTQLAWIYVLADPTGFPEIPSGSWRDRAP